MAQPTQISFEDDRLRPEASLAAFDSLAKGDPAPAWLAQGVCMAWGLDPASTGIRLITVSENASFRVEVGGAPYGVIRVSQPGYVGDAAQIRSELAWIAALGADTRIPILSAIEPEIGDGVVALGSPDGGRWHVVMFAFVTGTVLEDLGDPTPYYARIGELAARLHAHSRAWERPQGFSRFSWRLPDMIGSSARWGDWRDAELSADQAAVMDAAEGAAVLALGVMSEDREEWGIIHADLRPSNIMIDGDRLTIIDFDDCGQGWYLYDFASALSFIEHEDYAPAIAKEWIRGYEAITPLTEDQKRKACALSMIRRLQMLGWTTSHREDALPPAVLARQVDGTAEVAERFLEDPLWLLR